MISAFFEQRRAFDLSAYKQFPDGTSFTAGLASLAIEATRDHPFHERVNPFILEIRDSRVIDPSLGDRDVADFYPGKTPLDREERKAGLAIRDTLISAPDGTLTVWISPPGGPANYSEGRIVVGLIKIVDGRKIIDSYGICHEFSPSECLGFFRRLGDWSNASDVINDPEELRSRIVTIPPTETNPWQLMRDIVPLDEVWDAVESGSAKRLKAEVEKDTAEIATWVMPRIKLATSERDLVKIGAMAETAMMNRGWNLSSSPCGLLNSDLLGSVSFFSTSLSSGGLVLGSSESHGKYVHNCGQCGIGIYKYIEKGYRCSCGGVYEGC